jgi:hypothetical protein
MGALVPLVARQRAAHANSRPPLAPFTHPRSRPMPTRHAQPGRPARLYLLTASGQASLRRSLLLESGGISGGLAIGLCKHLEA